MGPFFGSSKNLDVIRLADVMLWKAEALIQSGDPNDALPLINALLTRAANSTGKTRFADGTAPSNYRISTYQPGVNCTWDQAYAFQALQFERRMEFGMEGTRFFDLVRWGNAVDVMNAWFSATAQGIQIDQHNLVYPIPQSQIDIFPGLYEQNPGY